LGIKDLEMLINIYKNLLLNDVHVGSLGFVKQFMEMEEALMNEK
jgi:hypothetical protein